MTSTFPSPAAAGFRCRACQGVKAGDSREASERMFQTGGSFRYGECAACGAWSMASVPVDLDRHYPIAYPAFAAGGSEPVTGRERWLDIDLVAPARLIATLVPDRNARILDVGAGNGRCLHDLWRAGYRQLEGVDLHLPDAAVQEKPFRLRRGTIGDCPGGWDVIMYHHVLEHVPEPMGEILQAADRLAPGGRLIIRVPLADSWARRHFDTFWLQWDAPRHLWLPTRAALRHMAAVANLKFVREIDDSRSNQVWASRLYRQGRSPANVLDVFPRRRQFLMALPLLAASHVWARWLNLCRCGDQAAFVLKKPLEALPQS